MSNSDGRILAFLDLPWRHPLATFAAGGAALAILVSTVHPDAAAFAFVSNIFTLVASSLISHLITYSNERKQFSKHLTKFADVAKRRVDMLCTDLNRLSIEISETPDLKESKRVVQYALKNLEQAAKASVHDIDEIRRIEEDDEVPPRSDQLVAPPTSTDRQSEPIEPTVGVPLGPPSNNDAPPALAQTEEKVIYTCPNCGYSNTGLLGFTQGLTKHVNCANCRTRLLLHRVARGGYKLIDPNRRALVNSENTKSSRHQANNLQAIGAGAAESSVEGNFACPRCQHRIAFRASADQRIIERPCFSCLEVVSFDRRDNVAKLLGDRERRYIDSIDIETMECLNCHKEFLPHLFKTTDGKPFIYCFACNTVYLQRSLLKVPTKKSCPTTGCENVVTFKLGGAESTARQFCFECMSRLLYNKETDEVTVLESLDLPKLALDEFYSNGQACPHCQQPTSGRTTTNSRGQRLCICWTCKGAFELTRVRTH